MSIKYATPCPHCFKRPKLTPVQGGFAWLCDCPTVWTYTDDHTSPLGVSSKSTEPKE